MISTYLHNMIHQKLNCFIFCWRRVPQLCLGYRKTIFNPLKWYLTVSCHSIFIFIIRDNVFKLLYSIVLNVKALIHHIFIKMIRIQRFISFAKRLWIISVLFKCWASTSFYIWGHVDFWGVQTRWQKVISYLVKMHLLLGWHNSSSHLIHLIRWRYCRSLSHVSRNRWEPLLLSSHIWSWTVHFSKSL